MTDQDDVLRHMLAELGYDAKWWLYGFLDDQFLQQQIARFRSVDDPNSEHYRYAAFLRVLETRGTLDDVTLARYVELVTLDSDQVMATSALIRLVLWHGVTDAQRTRLRAHPAFADPVVRRAFARVLNTGVSG